MNGYDASSAMARVEQVATVERDERLERMIREDYRLIWRLLRRLGVPPNAVDDATQQVFLVAAERLADIKPRSERAFAFGTALRVAQAVRRRAQREPGGVELDARSAEGPLPDELTDRKRARELADRVLGRMPLELRTVFVLFELEGLTSPEIARLVELPLGTVASRLRRARARFRDLVAHELAAVAGSTVRHPPSTAGEASAGTQPPAPALRPRKQGATS